MNKIASKQLYEKAGVPTPPYLVLQSGSDMNLDTCVSRFGFPMVVKPVVGGSSVGMSIVRSESDFQPALDAAIAEDKTILIEPYIQGIELTVGVIGNSDLEAFPVIEIVPDDAHEFFDYEAKYSAGVTEEICPARIDAEMTRKAQSYAKLAHQALFCKGYSRTDMILNDQDIYVLETNTIPGMTATSLLPQAASAAGLNFSQLLDRLIELSLEEQ
jgi:D-alanine-D-alanine ligase